MHSFSLWWVGVYFNVLGPKIWIGRVILSDKEYKSTHISRPSSACWVCLVESDWVLRFESSTRGEHLAGEITTPQAASSLLHCPPEEGQHFVNM